MENVISLFAANGNRNDVIQTAEQLLASDITIQIRCATALGWAMTELLGRCIVLVSWLKDNPPRPPDFTKHAILSPIRDPRERALTVMGRIRFLAGKLAVDKCKVGEQHTNAENFISEIDRHYSSEGNEKIQTFFGQPYIDLLEENVKTLCGFVHSDEINKQLCMEINFLLLHWSQRIPILLQYQPPIVYNAYTVARGFATIRWWIGIGEKDPARQGDSADNVEERPSKNVSRGKLWLIEHFPDWQHPEEKYDDQHRPTNALLSEATLDKLLDHLQSISSLLAPLVPQALEFSLVRWGKTILEYPDVWPELVPKPNQEGSSSESTRKKDAQSRRSESRDKQEEIQQNMKRALIKQATIWHDLLTDERDPTTFIRPHEINRRYFWKILRHSTPYFLVGLVIAVGVAFLIVYLQRFLSVPVTGKQNTGSQSFTDTIIITIVSIVSTIPFVRRIWLWGSKTTTNFISKYESTILSKVETAEKDALKLLWQRAQQEAVNTKTFVSPRSEPPAIDDGD